MSSLRIGLRLDAIVFAAFATAALAFVPAARSTAQTITIDPPQYPNVSVPFPYLYLNAATNWQYMTAPANSAKNATFLPSVPLTRIVGNVHWVNIQPGFDRSKPVTDPNTNQPTWSPTLAGIGMQAGANCSSGSWWPAAQCYPSIGNTAANPNNILYTFYTVPLWASAANGTHLSSTEANTYDGWNVVGYDNVNSQGNIGIKLSGVANIAVGDNILLYGNSYGSGQFTITVTPVVTGSVTEIYLPASGHSAPNSAGYVTFTTSHPPSDVYSGATCTLPDGSQSANGDCFFKSYVTYLMMHTCGNQNLTSKPSQPLDSCVIHYWEGWNEFGQDQFWNGTYTRLAKMMVDADSIIHDYCADCFFIAGSTSAGGDGGHYINPANRQYNNTSPDSSSVYLEALGQLLRDWYSQADQLTTTHKDIKPDAISFHPYWGYDTLSIPPMPESNAAAPWDPDMKINGQLAYPNIQKCTGVQQAGGSYYGTPAGCVNICGKKYTYNSSNGQTTSSVINFGPEQPNNQQLACTSYAGDPVDSTYGTAWPGCGTNHTTYTEYETRSQWVEPTNNPPADFITNHVAFEPEQACRDSFIDSAAAVLNLIPTMDSIETEIPKNWFDPNTPVWNTESSWGSFGDTTYPGQNARTRYLDPTDQSLGTFFQQAYIARMSILAAQTGVALNLWYQWDEDHLSEEPTPTPETCTPSFINWGKLGYDFPENYDSYSSCPVSNIHDQSGPKVERAGYTFNRVYHWLEGMHFTNKCSTSDGSVWTCGIANNSGYNGTLVWYTPFDQDGVYTVPAGLDCQKDIDGHLALVSSGSQHDTNNRPALYDNTPASKCTGTDGLPE